jgi:glycine cleavage system H protein
MYPEGYRYTKDHEWIAVAGDRGKVGITDYAQKQLGDVVFVELPEVGRKLQAGEQFGTIESVKAVSELYAPVAGEVVEANAPLAEKPETVNQDPHGAGWMIVLKLDSPAAASALMDAAAYAALVASEAK